MKLTDNPHEHVEHMSIIGAFPFGDTFEMMLNCILT